MNLPTSQSITAHHDACLAKPGWPPTHAPAVDPAELSTIAAWVAENHRHNCLLWAQEDLARRKTVADSEIVANKRAIDAHNQARNDAIERIDELLLLELGLVCPASAKSSAPLIKAPPQARLNSETAGSIIDRLSILSLKIEAMHQQSSRANAKFGHQEACRAKYDRLKVQRIDLARCLDDLLTDTACGKAWFQIYRQFKMYNDPKLNPALQAENALEILGVDTSFL